jgi:hypothetical protein
MRQLMTCLIAGEEVMDVSWAIDGVAGLLSQKWSSFGPRAPLTDLRGNGAFVLIERKRKKKR